MTGSELSLCVCAGAALGALATWFLLRNQRSVYFQHGLEEGAMEREVLAQRLAQCERRLPQLEQALAELRSAVAAGEARLAERAAADVQPGPQVPPRLAGPAGSR